jgi:hypothetical protein
LQFKKSAFYQHHLTCCCLDKLVRRNAQLTEIVDYIRTTQPERLHGYTGSDVDFILRLLREGPDSDMNHTSSLMTPVDSYGVGSIETHHSTASTGIRPGLSVTPRYTIDGNGNFNVADWHFVTVDHSEYDVLHEVAHGLHFASIAMLGFLVVEVCFLFLRCSVGGLEINGTHTHIPKAFELARIGSYTNATST